MNFSGPTPPDMVWKNGILEDEWLISKKGSPLFQLPLLGTNIAERQRFAQFKFILSPELDEFF